MNVCNHKTRHEYLVTNKRTGVQMVLFAGNTLESQYCSKRHYSAITCPFGYSNNVHQMLDGTEYVFQWYEIDTQGQKTECSGPDWNKLGNNCFGRLVAKSFYCSCCSHHSKQVKIE